MTSLATSSDRTLFFDFFPLEAVAIKGFKTKFALFTVPGQVIYNATRQIVLRGVDGIVFVADSQYDKMEENIETFKHLEENLQDAQPRISTTSLTSSNITSATCRTSAPGGISGVRVEQSRSPCALFRGFRLQVRRRLRDAEHDHPHAAAQIPERRRAGGQIFALPYGLSFLTSSRRTSITSTSVMRELLDKSEANIALLVEKAGYLIHQCGNPEQIDTTTFATLGSNAYNAVQFMASLVNESNFTSHVPAGRELLHPHGERG